MPEKRTSKQKAGVSAQKKKVSTTARATKKRRSVTAQKKPTTKKATTRSTSSSARSKKSTGKRRTPSEEVVLLPDSVSPRARLRGRMLRLELDEHLQKAMYRIAYTAGLCFLLVGSAYAVIPLYAPVEWQSAAVGSSSTGESNATSTIQYEPSQFQFLTSVQSPVTENQDVYFDVTNAQGIIAKLRMMGAYSSETVPVEPVSASKYRVSIKPETLSFGYYELQVRVTPLDGSGPYVRSTPEFFVGYMEITDPSPVPYEPSEVTFLTTPPSNITEGTSIDFKATNAQEISVKLAVVEGTGFIDVSHTTLSSGTHRAIIDPAKTQPGYYKLQVFVKPLDGSSPYSQATRQFFMGTQEIEYLYNNQRTTETDNGNVTTIAPEDDTSEEEKADAQTVQISIKDASNQDEEEQTAPPKEESPQTPTSLEPQFNLVSPIQRTLKDTATIKLIAPTNTATIELYARQVNSVSARYVASAFNRQGTLVFVFNSTNLPNGEYEFFARTQHNNRNLTTPSLSFLVQNSIQTTTQNSDSITTLREPIVAIQKPERFTETISTLPKVPAVDRNSAEFNAQQILLKDEVNFEELFNRYSLAQQTGDETLIRLAREELVRARERIYQRMVADQSEREFADSVAVQLQEKVDDIKNRVETFEALRRERTEGESARDTDGDGISDYDEIHLYGTDPFSADTDGDGIPDGVEIMSGLDPLVPDAEAIIRYESPKEVIGLTRADVLEVIEVIPVIEELSDNTPARVKSEIRGRALPNSYVTLYIFSTPTVVTIKTDADGSFVYTFDRELEDGQHDVYVAVTGNTGQIIAHSNRFSFVKEAQAFTPVDASESDFITPKGVVETTGQNAYTTTIGIAILAFGLILLMLGVSLRKGGAQTQFATISNEEDGDTTQTESDTMVKGAKFISQRKEHIDAS